MEGFNTDLLMYYLAGVGGALGGKGSWQDALGGMTQQFVATKSARDVLGKMLANAAKTGTEVKIGKDGLVMKTPASAFEEPKQGQQETPSNLGMLGTVAPKSEGGSGKDWNLNNVPKRTLDAFTRAGLLGNP